ncbi:pyruvate,water dikinase [Crossiella equi]|uniref:Pyruvate,water dikinase n=1 Tax=Crossiella equi TaxID=130796 RepID=A0ABS5AP14_9PSEU|nr:PEP/pyruvate-binding domain-containing protein [Crossiella equi]MBP2478137.1 pyruvate,water dikinase [Crossiella equi]
MTAFVLPLSSPLGTLDLVGGKAQALGVLLRAGLPVPDGFTVTTAAYHAFAAGKVPATGEPDEVAAAATAAFEGADLPEPLRDAVLAAYRELGAPAVAVRSSATAEDLPGLSFAGQQDSYLNITGERELLHALRRCWASLWGARAITYRRRHGVPEAGLGMGVVVQALVPARAAGVLFTVNPATGDRETVVNAAWGLGESVVGGQVTPDTYVVRDGGLTRREVADKTVRTVRAPGGTRDEAVPTELRWVEVLDQARVLELAALGERARAVFGHEVDVEWVLDERGFSLVQARPVTTVVPEVWNDSTRGDYLWTSANLGEAIPSVMTPMTWSLVQAVSVPELGGHPMNGNIGGRFYLNVSLGLGIGKALGLGGFLRRANENLWGRVDEDLPPLPVSRLGALRLALGMVRTQAKDARTFKRRLPVLLAEGPARCEALRARIAAAPDAGALVALWEDAIDGLLHVDTHVLSSGARTVGLDQARLRARLERLAGPEDTTALLSGAHGEGGELASLGPLLGLARVRDGVLDRETYARTWGHRGTDEFEVSTPRPAEDPGWLDRRLATLGTGDQDPSVLLARQAQARAAAARRLARRHPRQAARLRPRLARAAAAARSRELARSEFVRTFWVFRAFVERAGEVTGHGADLYFLSVAELVRVLRGDAAPLARVPARRAAHEHYRALPVYPSLIRGRFDPETWAADPDRRLDRYDEHARPQPRGEAVTGFGGVAGVVEGTVRVLASVEEGDALRPGEILVTSVTNIGWTPLFPRAAAVVTDIGAPLSHAAIVARELGIPAVVGCGDATRRLRTGDRVRVDGGQGSVIVL